jgi:ribose 5-phosphate isomerase A
MTGSYPPAGGHQSCMTGDEAKGVRDEERRGREAQKRAAAAAALEYVPAGAVIGVGTGSTAAAFIALLVRQPELVRAAVPSSEATAAALRAGGVRVAGLEEAPSLPLYVDGADEVDPRLRLIKGGGGAHTREKIVAAAAELFVCIVDESKLVGRLGGAPVPLAVVPSARLLVARRLTALGATVRERPGFVTDDGDAVLDATGLDLADPEWLETELDAIPGVVECGVFARRPADVVLCGTPAGVRTITRGATP